MNRLMIAALLSVVVGCSDGDDRAAASGADTTSAGRARNAAMVANAIAAKPSAADSILRAAGYTPAEFEQLLYDIAADSAMSATYTAAKIR